MLDKIVYRVRARLSYPTNPKGNVMKMRWFVGQNTKAPLDASFRTKKAAIEYGFKHIDGIFLVWKKKAV
jgi:hypothetical protein